MSNHHPGNEWYRRLIRSNRPLYRACPKHTKLLVAKAIVQAVEQQNGRFLEREKNSGDWYTIPYKRAVDKTSQGLREKDRELDDADEAKKVEYRKREYDSGLTGRANKAPTLEAMTTGVIQRAKSAQYAHPKPMGRRPSIAAGSVAPVVLQQPRTTPTTTDHNLMSPTDDLMPLPPTMHFRESSMFRNLQGTSLLQTPSDTFQANKQPRHILPKGTENLSQNSPTVVVQRKTSSATLPRRISGHVGQSFKQLPHTARTMQIPPKGTQKQPPYDALPGKVVPMMVPLQQQQQQQQQKWQHPMSPAKPGPSLTRFTSQVSDWLNSFWPTPAASESHAAVGHRSSVQQVQNIMAQLEPPNNHNSATAAAAAPLPPVQHHQELQPSPEAVAAVAGMPPPEAASKVTYKEKEKPVVTAAAHQPQQASREEAKDKEDSKPAAWPAQNNKKLSPRTKINKRKSSSFSSMPALPYAGNSSNDDDDDAISSEYRLTAAAAGGGDDSSNLTELEQSVSATLLQLATSPTRLFSGFTSYFADDLEDSGSHKRKRRSDVSHGSNKKKKAARKRDSLLDDYEESPMEARLRRVQYA